MDFLGMDFGILLKVIMLNIVLSGDNAILIALASKDLPPELQKKATFWGIFGAVILRLIFAVAVAYLVKVPLIGAIAGVILIGVAYKLLAGDDGHKEINGGSTLWSSVKTIIIADALMSLDNVLAIAGVAENFLQIIIGIVISVPIIVFASQLIVKLMSKFPIIVYIGAGVLSWAAGEMIVKDKIIATYLHGHIYHYGVPAVITVGVLLVGLIVSKKQKTK